MIIPDPRKDDPSRLTADSVSSLDLLSHFVVSCIPASFVTIFSSTLNPICTLPMGPSTPQRFRLSKHQSPAICPAFGCIIAQCFRLCTQDHDLTHGPGIWDSPRELNHPDGQHLILMIQPFFRSAPSHIQGCSSCI